MHDWWFGTRDSAVSMAITSDGNSYGVPEGLMFSFPLEIQSDGSWSVRKYNLNEFQKAKLIASANELLEERKIALGY